MQSEQLYARACALMPGGVNSPVRAFRGVGGTPVAIAEGHGALLRDVDGNEYIDYVLSWGPAILGHAFPPVVEAVQRAAACGLSFGASHAGEVALAEAVRQRMPHVEMMRFVNSGTEATMSAIRVARGVTGRPLLVKCAGCYHGHSDGLLVRAGSGVATLSLPDSAGVPEPIAACTRVVEFNDAEALEELMEADGERVACVILEPVAGNMGVVPPRKDYLRGVRELCDRYGALLIFDEVMTGFRVAPGGAAELYGVTPDLTCLGKVIGGGMPCAAYGGRRDYMECIAPVGSVYQAGTLSGNPLAMAAGLATLTHLTDTVYARIEAGVAEVCNGLQAAAFQAGVPMQLHRVGSLFSLFFTSQAVVDYPSALTTNRTLFARLFHGMLQRGVYLPPSALESWFFSAAHRPWMIERTVEAFSASLREALT